jgi:hypothetical protein
MPCAAQSSCITWSIVNDSPPYSLIDLRLASASSTETDPEVLGLAPTWTVWELTVKVSFDCSNFPRLSSTTPIAVVKAPATRPRKDLRLRPAEDTNNTIGFSGFALYLLCVFSCWRATTTKKATPMTVQIQAPAPRCPHTQKENDNDELGEESLNNPLP